MQHIAIYSSLYNQTEDLCSGSNRRCLAEYSYIDDPSHAFAQFPHKKTLFYNLRLPARVACRILIPFVRIFCFNLWQLYRYMTFYLPFFVPDFGIHRIWHFARPFVLVKISLDLGLLLASMKKMLTEAKVSWSLRVFKICFWWKVSHVTILLWQYFRHKVETPKTVA